MSNPYYDPELLEIWRERITRLRAVSDMPAPWDVDADVERWKRGLGPNGEDALNSHLLDWQVWIRSLTAEHRLEYQVRHPEPEGWGLYRLTFSRPTASGVPEDKGPDVYWDSLTNHYEAAFGMA